MTMEDKESTETSSHSEAESPPVSISAVFSGVNDGFKEGCLREGVSDDGCNKMVKKKRGRPTKYDSDGNLRVQYISSPNWKFFSSGEVFANTAGTDFIPHVVTIHTGEDVAGELLSIAQKGPRGICILSANGTVSNVTLHQPSCSGGLLTFEGRFDILTLTGSFTPSQTNGMKGRTGGLSISLAGPDGRVVGGGVAGGLLAASPIQVVFGSFIPNSYEVHKRKRHEPRMAPVVNNARETVTEAIPVSLAAPASIITQVPATNITQVPATNITQVSETPFSVYSHGELNTCIINNGENPNSTSTGSADYNNSGPTFDARHYPDINVSISFD